MYIYKPKTRFYGFTDIYQIIIGVGFRAAMAFETPLWIVDFATFLIFAFLEMCIEY